MRAERWPISVDAGHRASPSLLPVDPVSRMLRSTKYALLTGSRRVMWVPALRSSVRDVARA